MFFNRKHRLTKLCERVSLPALERAAMDDASLWRAKFDKKRAGESDSDRWWAELMRDAKHPKRSMIIYMIVSLAAAEFWKEANKKTDDPIKGVSENPFKSTNSDVIVAEALMFYLCNFYLFLRPAVRKEKLTEADVESMSVVATTIGHVIQETTQWPIVEILGSRMDEYFEARENPTEVFSQVILRSIGKKSINDPDRLDPNLNDMLISMRTIIHVTAMLPGYFEIYKKVVQHYPMD